MLHSSEVCRRNLSSAQQSPILRRPRGRAGDRVYSSDTTHRPIHHPSLLLSPFFPEKQRTSKDTRVQRFKDLPLIDTPVGNVLRPSYKSFEDRRNVTWWDQLPCAESIQLEVSISPNVPNDLGPPKRSSPAVSRLPASRAVGEHCVRSLHLTLNPEITLTTGINLLTAGHRGWQ